MNAYRFNTTITENHVLVLPYDMPTGRAEVVVHFQPTDVQDSDENGRLAWLEKILAMADAIPEEELAKIPTDASVNLDHYLYGAPKQEP